MIRSKDGIKIFYDREADVLYVTRGKPEYTDYVEHSDDVILRLEPETKQLVGFTIIDFLQALRQTGIGHRTTLWH